MENKNIDSNREQHLVIVRGGGDLATGTIHRLWSAGFPVMVLEVEKPAAIRRCVSVCEAVYDGEVIVEGMHAKHIHKASEVHQAIRDGFVPVLIDSQGESISELQPEIVVDAILAKRNLGTTKDMAPLVVGLGPGFCAGEDVDVVIETKRGHDLGRIIRKGRAMSNTGVPGVIGGFGKERVLRASDNGTFYAREGITIGTFVSADEEIASIIKKDGTCTPVMATISGVLRGVLRDGFEVTKGFKIGDIDPRTEEQKNCYSISDKARCISGSVLEVCVSHVLTI